MAELRSMNCPSCGAPLQFQEGQGLIICKHCGETIQLTRPQMTPPPPQTPQIPQMPRMSDAPRPAVNLQPPSAYAPPPTFQSRPRARSAAGGVAGCGCAAILLVATLLFVGGVLLFSGAIPLPADLQKSLQGVVPLNMIVFEGATLVPSADDALPEVVALAQDNSGSELSRAMVKIGPDGKMVWRAQPFTDDSAYLYAGHMTTADGVFYVAAADTLYAYQLSDGATLWQASLSDSLYPNCKGCVQLFDDHLMVLSSDGALQGFAAKTGEAEWSHTLQASTYDVYRIGEEPAVLDEDDDGSALFFLDPATGEVTRRLAPTCTTADDFFTAELEYYDSDVFYDAANEALYLIFGTFEGCVQRWSLSGDEPEWDAHITSEEGFSSSYELTTLFDGDTLYLSSENGHLWAFDTRTGDWNALLAEADTQFRILGVQAGVGVVQVVETRGTYEYALWGVDTATGDVLWEHSFGKAEPLIERASGSLSSGDSTWIARLVNDGVLLLQAKSDPNQLTLTTLDLQDGSPSAETTLPLTRTSLDSFYSISVIDWRTSRVWLLLDYHVYRLNTDTAELEFVWP